MRGFTRHERRWASDSIPGDPLTGESSPVTDFSVSDLTPDEYVEVTLDLQDDDTVILRSVEPAAVTAVDDGGVVVETPPSSASRSPTMRRSSSNRLLQFSQELKAEAVAKAKHFSQELRRFSWNHVQASRALSSSSSFNGAVVGSGGASTSSTNGLDSALAARAIRRQRAQLDRTRSGAQKALRGLKFISNRKTNGIDGWDEVQSNFDKLNKDGFLHRSDFAQCIGTYTCNLINHEDTVPDIAAVQTSTAEMMVI